MNSRHWSSGADKIRSEAIDAERNLATSKSERIRVGSDVAKLRTVYEALTKEVRGLEAAAEEAVVVEEDLKRNRTELERIQGEIDRARRETRALREEQVALVADRERMQARVRDLTREREELEATSKGLASAIETQQEGLADARRHDESSQRASGISPRGASSGAGRGRHGRMNG